MQSAGQLLITAMIPCRRLLDTRSSLQHCLVHTLISNSNQFYNAKLSVSNAHTCFWSKTFKQLNLFQVYEFFSLWYNLEEKISRLFSAVSMQWHSKQLLSRLLVEPRCALMLTHGCGAGIIVASGYRSALP